MVRRVKNHRHQYFPNFFSSRISFFFFFFSFFCQKKTREASQWPSGHCYVHAWSISQFLKIQLTCLQQTAYLQPCPLRAVCLYHTRPFLSKGADCRGFACFCSAQESVKCLVIHTSLLPQFTQRVLGKPLPSV